MKSALIANVKDNVANAIDDIKIGDHVSYLINNKIYTVEAVDTIKFGFKIAVKPIEKHETVIKYGCVIGKASTAIKAGECVHVHNVEGTRGRGDKEGV